MWRRCMSHEAPGSPVFTSVPMPTTVSTGVRRCRATKQRIPSSSLRSARSSSLGAARKT
jgi:hypothetical protein